ncbi:MAG: hypothetical protein WBO55_02700 [Rhizobiaceae bacterium]
MTSPDMSPAKGAPIPASKGGNAYFWAILSTIFIIIFICTEIWLVVGVVEWSLVSLFGLGIYGYVGLGLVLVPLGLWASWQTAYLAWTAEMELAASGDN